MNRINLWSSGGGTQSTAIAVLILQGKLPRPDLAVIADTEREKSSTWEYMNQYTAPALRAIGIPIHRISKSDWGAPDLIAKNGRDMLMPLFTDQSGTLSKLPTLCSNEWKQRPVHRFASSQFPDSQFRVWMGISADEARRIKPTTGKWETWYPLFEMRLTRQDCGQLVRDYGWPSPPQSSCWMCPNRSARQWVDLSINAPGDFAAAVALEVELRERDDEVYLHQYGKPLEQAITMTPPENGHLWDTERCDSGQCFV